jgi:toxin ParE1/3/4
VPTSKRVIVYTPRAEKDLDTIRFYSIKHWGQRQTTAYMKDMLKRIKELAHFTHAPHPIVLTIETVELRCIYAGQHAVYYNSGSTAITVVRILHQRMDAPAHL